MAPLHARASSGVPTQIIHANCCEKREKEEREMTESKKNTQKTTRLQYRGVIDTMPVAGISIDGRQGLTHALARAVRNGKRAWVELRREPKNPHDANAIAVVAHTDTFHAKVGYVPADIASTLAPFIDRGGRARIQAFGFVGGYAGRNIGMRLNVTLFS